MAAGRLERIVKELDALSAKLDAPRLTGAARLELLRRQATLGDRRDEAIEARRREQAPPPSR
jgi:hypothetical protein